MEDRTGEEAAFEEHLFGCAECTSKLDELVALTEAGRYERIPPVSGEAAKALQQAGVSESMNVVVELGSPEAIKGLVATGLGFAIMSRVIAAKELQLGQLVQVPLSPPLIRNFSVVYPKERFHSKLVAAFLQFAKDQLAAGQRLAA
jgi:DNA-binding transcriptional LysR family regulator